MPTTILSRVFQREDKKLKLPDSDDDSEDERTSGMSEEKMERLEKEAIRREKEMKNVKGMEGIYYKVNISKVTDIS